VSDKASSPGGGNPRALRLMASAPGLVLVAVAAVVFSLGAATLIIWSLRANTITDALQDMQGIGLALGAETARSLQAVDLASQDPGRSLRESICGRGRVLERGGDANAGCNDQDVEPAECLHDTLDHRGTLRFPAYVGLDRQRLAGGEADASCQVIQPIDAARGDRQACALVRQSQGRRFTNAGRSSDHGVR